MANFYIQSNINVIPIEEIAFTDTTQKAKGIHSTIDRIFSNSYERLIGTDYQEVVAKNWNPSSINSSSLATLLEITATSAFKFLYIKLKTRGADTEGLGPKMTIDAGGAILEVPFASANAFFISCGFDSGITAEDILLYGGTSYSSSSYEILAAIYETDV